MIISEYLGNLPPILLSVVLIIYLIIVELGDKNIKKELLPFVIVLTLLFLIIAVTSVLTTYARIK